MYGKELGCPNTYGKYGMYEGQNSDSILSSEPIRYVTNRHQIYIN